MVHHAPDLSARPLHVVSFGWETLADAKPQALGLTYWFDTAPEGKPYRVTIRFTGRRLGVKGKPGPRDRFSVLESIDQVVPGSGPVAVTTRVYDVTPGNWHVTATPVDDPRPGSATSRSPSTRRPRLPKGSSSGTTVFAPIVRVLAPGARLGVWPALVGLGAAVALTVQALLAARSHLPVSRVLLVSLVACLVGLVGAKLYYLTGHWLRGRRPSLLTAGMCIQGFVLGAIGTLVIGAWATGMPVGAVLDVTAPGLLFGMTIGRFGCFFGGCCAGRPTASRWGLWSSDRRLGMRRMPTQLLESAVALLVALAALGAVWATTPQPAGVVFVGAIAAYTFGRQLLFPLRAGPRHTAHGRTLTMALAGLVAAVAIVVAAFAASSG
ncbi:MAG TPA: prolipoprotein diacylglyceryl transferase family protein [Actinomycetes bacterium]|nr:prolipoprotein diacylglyceryl transferase family protein [Actinomycetes bacterium]